MTLSTVSQAHFVSHSASVSVSREELRGLFDRIGRAGDGQIGGHRVTALHKSQIAQWHGRVHAAFGAPQSPCRLLRSLSISLRSCWVSSLRYPFYLHFLCDNMGHEFSSHCESLLCTVCHAQPLTHSRLVALSRCPRVRQSSRASSRTLLSWPQSSSK